MITLPTQFVSGEGGYSANPLTYTQITRTETLAIYQRFSAEGSPKDFEVIRIRVIPKGTAIFNAPPTLDDEEKYAVTSSWGKAGWSFNNLTAAQNKFIDLKNESVTAPETQLGDEITVDGVKYFTVGQYAANHNMQYVNANLIVKDLMAKGSIKFVGEKRLNAKGKASKIYANA